MLCRAIDLTFSIANSTQESMEFLTKDLSFSLVTTMPLLEGHGEQTRARFLSRCVLMLLQLLFVPAESRPSAYASPTVRHRTTLRKTSATISREISLFQRQTTRMAKDILEPGCRRTTLAPEMDTSSRTHQRRRNHVMESKSMAIAILTTFVALWARDHLATAVRIVHSLFAHLDA